MNADTLTGSSTGPSPDKPLGGSRLLIEDFMDFMEGCPDAGQAHQPPTNRVRLLSLFLMTVFENFRQGFGTIYRSCSYKGIP